MIARDRPYDATDDTWRSVGECYRVIRERMQAGGAGWGGAINNKGNTNMKTTLICADWKPLRRGTLAGFADVQIKELHLTINGCALHQRDGKRWCQLPGRPMLKDGAAITDDSGKVKYFPTMLFNSKQVADAFSAATIAAVVAAFPDAFDAPERKPAMAGDEMNDEIPF